MRIIRIKNMKNSECEIKMTPNSCTGDCLSLERSSIEMNKAIYAATA
ncbi:MAG: hypothetical protein LBB24_02130 [Rickettsiales bacterium]|nr:hypothetical protein [Rickettsiales bacterium]